MFDGDIHIEISNVEKDCFLYIVCIDFVYVRIFNQNGNVERIKLYKEGKKENFFQGVAHDYSVKITWYEERWFGVFF